MNVSSVVIQKLRSLFHKSEGNQFGDTNLKTPGIRFSQCIYEVDIA